MKSLLITVAVAAMAITGSAEAKGCIKGAIVGGIAGHIAHHHALTGAIIGCAVGHHMAHEQDLKRRREEALQHGQH